MNFTQFGVYPRSLGGLKGILFSPFIHSGTKHLFNNSIPVFVFLAMLFYFYKEVAWKIILLGSLLTGCLTWLIGSEGFHIGMSGVVYLLFSFVFFSGIFRRHFRLISVSLVVIFLYGSMFWYVFPIEKGVSWEGHLSGLIIGFIFSVLYRKKGSQRKEYIFQKTEFDLLFDEKGNFNPPQVEEEETKDS
ncbi:rhomboid family intramembrane serine protease [Flavicella sp.]|uniref:rhomboid family intramembrane serine protease n=1 Tax=Flavicella sp. TaxID=2957742 RepID=UPI00301A97FF